MHSYISSSEYILPASADKTTRRYGHAIALSLVCFTLLLASLELGVRLVLHRVSKIEHRVETEHARARAIRSDARKPTILLVGNSLLLKGLQYPVIEQRFAPQVAVVRFVIENTQYFDWYYGIRRLLSEGAHPHTIVLCLNTPQLLSPATHGDIASYHLFAASDLLNVSRTAQYDATQTSGLLLGHYSLFYATRNNLRSYILGLIAPAYVSLAHDFVTHAPLIPKQGQIAPEAERRLRRLNTLVSGYGVHFIFLVPPGFIAGDAELRSAAMSAGVPIWIPFPEGQLPVSLYADHFHLNEQGARIFTQSVSVYLDEWIRSQRLQQSGARVVSRNGSVRSSAWTN